MATRNDNTASTASTTSTRRRGRPSNASKAAAVASQNEMLIDVAVAAASAAVKAAMGIATEGGVASIGIPQGSQSQGSQSQGSQSQGSQSQGSQSQGSQSQGSQSQGRKAPGRKTDSNSKASLTRAFYDQNLNRANPLNRADFVKAAAEKFGYSPQTANTYVSNIERESGYKLVSRGGATRGSRRSTRSSNDSGQATGTNG